MRNIPLLRIAFLSGFLLLLLIGGALAGIAISGSAAARATSVENTFHRLMREYDFRHQHILSAESSSLQRREFERLAHDLDRMERHAEGVETWLSLLKRRRFLARLDSRYEQSYRQSARRAAAAFPHSESIAAIAAAALIHHTAITREAEAQLRASLPLLDSPRFAPLRLSIHVLLGDFAGPAKALASLPSHFVEPGYFNADVPDAALMVSDMILLRIIAGDIPAAAIDIQAALALEPSAELIRLAAEFFYDFGDMLRAAELFSLLPDEEALSRQADALWLAGYDENARAIWAILAAQGISHPWYNYALTAYTDEEEAALLERLVEYDPDRIDDAWRYGLIRLSRLQDAPRALALLGAADPGDTLIELEILRRRTEIEPMPRMIAETWLLLDRFPRAEAVYQWGAWYFDLQRHFTESAKLLQTAARHRFTGDWIDLHEAMRCMREGNLDAAEDLFAALMAVNGNWTAAANGGRILEAQRDPARALEHYEWAVALLRESMDDQAARIASQIQVRIAYCHKSLHHPIETRRALEHALALNPDNLTARFELNRLE